MTTPAAPLAHAAEQAAELRSQRRRRIAARTDQVRAHAAARAAEYTGAPQAWLNVMRDATRDVAAAAAEQHMIEHVLDLLDMFPTRSLRRTRGAHAHGMSRRPPRQGRLRSASSSRPS